MICFNRNIVECKFADFCKKGSAVASFNRNIVECKCLFSCDAEKPAGSFNRNIVECKYDYEIYGSGQMARF